MSGTSRAFRFPYEFKPVKSNLQKPILRTDRNVRQCATRGERYVREFPVQPPRFDFQYPRRFPQSATSSPRASRKWILGQRCWFTLVSGVEHSTVPTTIDPTNSETANQLNREKAFCSSARTILQIGNSRRPQPRRSFPILLNWISESVGGSGLSPIRAEKRLPITFDQRIAWFFAISPAGFEPTTFGFGGRERSSVPSLHIL